MRISGVVVASAKWNEWMFVYIGDHLALLVQQAAIMLLRSTDETLCLNSQQPTALTAVASPVVSSICTLRSVLAHPHSSLLGDLLFLRSPDVSSSSLGLFTPRTNRSSVFDEAECSTCTRLAREDVNVSNDCVRSLSSRRDEDASSSMSDAAENEMLIVASSTEDELSKDMQSVSDRARCTLSMCPSLCSLSGDEAESEVDVRSDDERDATDDPEDDTRPKKLSKLFCFCTV